MEKLVKNEDVDLTPGEQTRDFIYIDDVTNAYETVLSTLPDESFREFDVCTGKSISLRDFVETAKTVLHSSSQLNWGALPYRENEIMISKGDAEPLKRLGWTPKYGIKEGILKTI
jgi:nucleoside-diphosphate-sugar epimerase